MSELLALLDAREREPALPQKQAEPLAKELIATGEVPEGDPPTHPLHEKEV